MPASENEPEGWSGADKFTEVLETTVLNATEGHAKKYSSG